MSEITERWNKERAARRAAEPLAHKWRGFFEAYITRPEDQNLITRISMALALEGIKSANELRSYGAAKFLRLPNVSNKCNALIGATFGWNRSIRDIPSEDLINELRRRLAVADWEKPDGPLPR